MADGASAQRVDMARALPDAGFPAVLSLGLLLPLIGFQTITDTRNNLVLVTRWPLLFGLVAFVGIARFVFSIAIAPYLTQRGDRAVAAPSTARNLMRKWFVSFSIAFVVAYPGIVVLIEGFAGAVKWIDNFGFQILIYVMLGWGVT